MTSITAHAGGESRATRGVDCRQVLDGVTAGVLAVADDGEILAANEWAARVLRASKDALVGRRIDDVLAPLDRLLATQAQGCPLGGDRRRELSVRLEDGTTICVGFSVGPLDPSLGEGGHHVVLLFQEIGSVLELRRERDRLLQMAALGDALPSVLHELRNPLAAVTAMLEVMIEEPSIVNDGSIQRDLHAVLSEVRRMTLGLDGIGGFVRSTRTRRYAAVDHAVREACRILEPTAARKGVRLEAVGPDLPLLPIDAGVVSGVVFNLVKNAIDACTDGQRIEVDARVLDDELVLVVRDTGHGMSNEVLARCQDLFFTNKDKGSGIGLALCRQVAESSGGRLEIASELGRGTIVTMRVPLRRPTPGGE